ncbi:class I SAM-dependent methyltransferase [Maridesulfovibrio bastinii]|uniref:class I SAM-dependent methyltransferase n=1 Tax=Maridesulfovibrio bastinii TaxID=47157 RepID=UPI000423383A|nr:class I SAM-dependent methyltransferase [Maridesulfovibrio bastinii]
MAIPEKDRDFYRYTKDHRFAPMYPLLARELVEKYDLKDGRCLDIGTGSGALAIELAKLTTLSITAIDAEADAVEMAKENCLQNGLSENSIKFITAPVENIPLDDSSFDIIISRGSVPFWSDYVAAFKEIKRLLAPGGVALIGCGFSHFQTMEEVEAMRPKLSPEKKKRRFRWKQSDFLSENLRKAEVIPYDIIDDSYGSWVEIRNSLEK